jgi:sortase A
MRKKDSTENLTVEELRRLLVENRRSARQERLERFRRTGRVVTLASNVESPTLDNLRAGSLPDGLEQVAGQPVPSRRKQLLDAALLVVELAAVLGLLFVLFSGYELLRDLNQESQAAQKLPTLTPTPLIVAVVLPSGHTPPDSPGGARPNDAEIPEHLRPLVQSLANIPIPTPGPEQAIRIQIPSLNVDAPIVMGDGWEQLKKGVGQHVGTANPGEKDNLVLTAHNDIFGEIFRDLERLKAGDEVILYTSQHAYTYVVASSKIVEPTQVDVMSTSNSAIVTLVSCYPYLVDSQRIVVVARLQQD